MLTRKITFCAAAFVAGVAVFAHHVSVPFSSIFGQEILTDVVFYKATGKVGVPAYHLGGDSHTYALVDGTSLTVSDGHGHSEVIEIRAGDYADVVNATEGEIVESFLSQLTLGEVYVQNGTLTLRGREGGSGSQLEIQDNVGAPLTHLGFQPGMVTGSDNIGLVLSLPEGDDHHDDHIQDLVGHTYVVLASASEGATAWQGAELPFEADRVTGRFLRAARLGLLRGFVGVLDGHEDALAVLPAATLDQLFPLGHPDELYLAYIVLSEDLEQVEYVSNRFTVHFED